MSLVARSGSSSQGRQRRRPSAEASGPRKGPPLPARMHLALRSCGGLLVGHARSLPDIILHPTSPVQGDAHGASARRVRPGRGTVHVCRSHDDPGDRPGPVGPEVDGRRLLGEAVGFGRALRAAGLAHRPWRRGRLRPGAATRRHRRSRAGPGRRRGHLRPASRRSADLRRRVRPLVAPARPPPGRLRAPPFSARARRDGGRGGGRPERAVAGDQRAEQAADERGVPMPCAGDDDAEDDSESRASSSRPMPTRAASCCATVSSTG